MASDKKWVLAVDGVELDPKYDDEESANSAGARVRKQNDSPNLRIAVYQPGSARHKKAIEKGWAPKPA